MDVPTTQARYHVRLYSTAGALLAVFDDWRTLELQRRVGTYDLLTFSIDGTDSRVSLFTLDSIVEVWRKLADIPPISSSSSEPAGYAYTVLQDDPSGYWRLGEPVGQTAASDLSGNANTGTYTGGVTLGQAGALAPELDGSSDTAALFDGVNGYVAVPDSVAIGQSFTVEFWAKSTPVVWNVNGPLVSARVANGFIIHPEATTRRIRLYVYTSAAGIVELGNYVPSSITSYAHYVFTYNGTTGAWVFYINGASVHSGTNLQTRVADTIPLAIGRDYGLARYLSGTMDEVAVYPIVLSATRVLAHYNAGLNQHNSDYRTFVTYTPGTTYPWYREATLLHRTPGRQITERGTRIFTCYARGLVDLLRRREILYPANTTFTLKGGPAETAMKAYVEENAGPSALEALGRAADGALSGFTVEPNVGRGIEWAGQRSWQNLLDVLQEISAAGGVDYDVVRTDVPGSGSVTFEFRCYFPQLGTDRSITVQFATQFGTMQNPFYTLSRTEEYNRVVALGAGQESARRFIVQESTYTVDSPWNTIEKTQDARQEETLSGLIAIAEAALNTGQPQEQFTFSVLQTSTYQYGRDYFLGDIVSAAFDDDISTTKKITGVTLNVSEGRENISITFSDVPVYA